MTQRIQKITGISTKTVKVSLLNTLVFPRPISSTASHFSSLTKMAEDFVNTWATQYLIS